MQWSDPLIRSILATDAHGFACVEIDMSKPRLRLVHSSDNTRPGAVSSWEAGLDLIDLGLLISCRCHMAFLQASMAILEAMQSEDSERTFERLS